MLAQTTENHPISENHPIPHAHLSQPQPPRQTIRARDCHTANQHRGAVSSRCIISPLRPADSTPRSPHITMQTLARLKTRRRPPGLRALSQAPKKRGALWDRARVEAAAAARRRHEQALASARWATSWMMPWERAQMDVPTRPLKLWERVYWRLFVVLGGVGFAYETWVLGNRRILLPKTDAGLADVGVVCREDTGLYHGNHAFRSHRFLTDDELKTVAGK